MRRYATFWGTFGLSRKTGSMTIRLLSRLTLLDGIPGIIFARVLGNLSTPMSHLQNLSAHIIITKKIIVSNMYLASPPKNCLCVDSLCVCVCVCVSCTYY